MKQYSKLAIVILLFASCSQQDATLTDFESENIELFEENKESI